MHQLVDSRPFHCFKLDIVLSRFNTARSAIVEPSCSGAHQLVLLVKLEHRLIATTPSTIWSHLSPQYYAAHLVLEPIL